MFAEKGQTHGHVTLARYSKCQYNDYESTSRLHNVTLNNNNQPIATAPTTIAQQVLGLPHYYLTNLFSKYVCLCANVT